MSSKMLVINEWIFHDLQRENGRERHIETFRFLQDLQHRRERLAFLKESDWAAKAWGLMGSNDPHIKPLSRLLQKLLMDSNKCLILQPEAVEGAAPQDAIDASPEEDVYLIQTYYAAGADLLVTTDEGLLDAFESREDVQVVHRDDFLKNYLSS